MNRITQLDGIRGLMLVIMTIDHISPTLIKLFSNRLGYLSAAEGFVFLSGLLAGIVYSKKILREGIRSIQTKIHARAFLVYKYHIATCLLAIILCICIPDLYSYWKNNPPFVVPQSFPQLIGLVTLLYQSKFLDVLPIYIIFLAATPLVMTQLLYGRWKLVLMVSLIVWIFNFVVFKQVNLIQYFPSYLNFGSFNVLGWQFLFFGGVVLGYLFSSNQLPFRTDNVTLFRVCLVIFGLIFFEMYLSKFGIIKLGLADLPIPYAIDKDTLGLIRVIDVYAFIYIIAFLMNKYKQLFAWSWLSFIGKHSLQVYCYHCLLVMIFKPFVLYAKGFSVLFDIAITLLLVVSLRLPAYLHEKYTNRKSQYKPAVVSQNN
jgi:hypothetical protein